MLLSALLLSAFTVRSVEISFVTVMSVIFRLVNVTSDMVIESVSVSSVTL